MENSRAVVLALLLRRRRNKRKRLFWVHPINQKRSTYGEYCHLVNELRLDEERFRMYFHLPPNVFEELLEKVGPTIFKKDTNYRRSISVSERLAITLR
jgi:hypothetical protein